MEKVIPLKIFQTFYETKDMPGIVHTMMFTSL